MKNSAQNMKPGDVSLGLTHHFIGAFGRAGGTPEMLQQAADDRSLMQRLIAVFLLIVFVTRTYFVARPGLWVDKDFTSRITAAYPEQLVLRGLDGVESFDLTNHMSDKRIIGRLLMGGEENVRKHAFTPDQIATLIDRQPNGSEGKLLSNGDFNLFYMIGAEGVLFVVGVHWTLETCEWCVAAYELNEGGDWDAGVRVFFNTQV